MQLQPRVKDKIKMNAKYNKILATTSKITTTTIKTIITTITTVETTITAIKENKTRVAATTNSHHEFDQGSEVGKRNKKSISRNKVICYTNELWKETYALGQRHTKNNLKGSSTRNKKQRSQWRANFFTLRKSYLNFKSITALNWISQQHLTFWNLHFCATSASDFQIPIAPT